MFRRMLQENRNSLNIDADISNQSRWTCFRCRLTHYSNQIQKTLAHGYLTNVGSEEVVQLHLISKFSLRDVYNHGNIFRRIPGKLRMIISLSFTLECGTDSLKSKRTNMDHTTHQRSPSRPLVEVTIQQNEETYWSLPLFVTKSTPDRPCVMKSSGIMDSILSFLKDKFA
jgi:hypothetical protein